MFDSHTLDLWEQWVSPGSAASSSSPANSLSQSDWDSFLSSEVPIYDNLLYLSEPNLSEPFFNSNAIQDHLIPSAQVPSDPVPSNPSPNSVDINPDEHCENPLMIQPDSSTITLADLTAANFLTRGSTNGALWTVSANHETVPPQPTSSRPAPELINDEIASQKLLGDHAPGLSSQYASTLSSQSPTASSIITSPPTEIKTATAKPGRKRTTGDEPDDDRAEKRRRNTMAAAKYRQKKLDRISELEESLDTVTKERDDLKLELARRDAEFALLKKLLMERDPYRGN